MELLLAGINELAYYSAVTIIEIDIEIAILHSDRMGSKSRSFLFDLCRFSLGDGQQSARDVISKVITRDALDFVRTEALYNGMMSADVLFTRTSPPLPHACQTAGTARL